MLLLFQLGEGVLHVRHHRLHQLAEEARLALEYLLAEAHATTQDAAEHVATASVAGHGAVGDGHGEGADVVGHHAVAGSEWVAAALRRVLLAVLVVLRHAVLPHDESGVWSHTAQGVDGIEEGHEHVRVVVGHLAYGSGRAVAGTLQNGSQALEAHARVHVLGGKGVKLARLVARELHEHQVPDLDHVRIVLVHQRGSIAIADAIVVDLGAYV